VSRQCVFEHLVGGRPPGQPESPPDLLRPTPKPARRLASMPQLLTQTNSEVATHPCRRQQKSPKTKLPRFRVHLDALHRQLRTFR
jgi:hypothetical protein